MTFPYRQMFQEVNRIFQRVSAVIASLAAGIVVFFLGFVVPVYLWERFARKSAEAPVIVLGLILGVVLALAAVVGSAWWLWPKRSKDLED